MTHRGSPIGRVGLVVFISAIVVTFEGVSGAVRLVPTPEYPTIQAAIDASSNGDVVIVSEGIYSGPGNRDLNFGGRAITVRSTDPNDPNVVAATVIDAGGTELENHRGFLFESGEGPDAVVAGLTIQNGYAVSAGGILIESSSPTITKCTIASNTGTGGVCAGGIMCWLANPMIEYCTITGNSGLGPALACGGIVTRESSPTIAYCTITDNFAEGYGGGGCSYLYSNPLFTNCLVANNYAAIDGGGIETWWSTSVRVYNCTITGNVAHFYGGGLDTCTDTNLDIRNCTITNNVLLEPNGYGAGVTCWKSSTVNLDNCIIWNNSSAHGSQITMGSEFLLDTPETVCTLTLNHCIVRNEPNDIYVDPFDVLIWGEGTVDDDPQFVDADGPDDDPNTWADNDFHLSPSSPGVDGGDPNGDYAGQVDIDGHPRVMPDAGIVDIGSDEFPGAPYFYTLALTIDKKNLGSVEVEPNLADLPPLVFPAGSQVVLTAVPVEGKVFDHWEIYDPNHPGDANFATIDANEVTSLVMTDDLEVLAVFDCGNTGPAPAAAMVIGMLTVTLLARRRR